jgi:hypothetical protein
MKNFVVALYSDAPGSGKSTVANGLLEHGFVRLKFASALKNMLAAHLAYCGATREEVHRMLEGDLKEQPCDYLCGRTPRHAMQTLGTEWGRDLIGDKIWLDAIGRKIDMYSGAEAQTPIVIDDLRFPNEWDYLDTKQNIKTFFYRIIRKGEEYVGGHASEKGLRDHTPFQLLINFAKSAEEFERFAVDLILSDIEEYAHG